MAGDNDDETDYFKPLEKQHSGPVRDDLAEDEARISQERAVVSGFEADLGQASAHDDEGPGQFHSTSEDQLALDSGVFRRVQAEAHKPRPDSEHGHPDEQPEGFYQPANPREGPKRQWGRDWVEMDELWRNFVVLLDRALGPVAILFVLGTLAYYAMFIGYVFVRSDEVLELGPTLYDTSRWYRSARGILQANVQELAILHFAGDVLRDAFNWSLYAPMYILLAEERDGVSLGATLKIALSRMHVIMAMMFVAWGLSTVVKMGGCLVGGCLAFAYFVIPFMFLIAPYILATQRIGIMDAANLSWIYCNRYKGPVAAVIGLLILWKATMYGASLLGQQGLSSSPNKMEIAGIYMFPMIADLFVGFLALVFSAAAFITIDSKASLFELDVD